MNKNDTLLCLFLVSHLSASVSASVNKFLGPIVFEICVHLKRQAFLLYRSFSNSAQVSAFFSPCVLYFILLCFNVNSDWSGAVQPILQPGGRHIRFHHQLSRILHGTGRKQSGGRMYQVWPKITVLRIRDVYPGSRIFSHSGSHFFHPESAAKNLII